MKTLLLVPLLFAVPLLAPAADALPGRTLPAQWVVDPVHSSVVFRIKHANAAWFHGTFEKIEGSVSVDPDDLANAKVSLVVPLDGLDTNNAQRDTHLKSPDFFNSKENPEIRFTSTKVTGDAERMSVTGDLSFAGKTKSITIPVEKVGEGELQGKKLVGYTTSFTVKRSDFGMTYGIAENMICDEVALRIDVELNPAQ